MTDIDLMGKVICSQYVGLVLMILMLNGHSVQGQSLYEIGFGGGTSGYSGELSRSFLSSPGYNVSAYYRSNIDDRFTLTLEGDYGLAQGGPTALGLTFPSGSDFSTTYYGVDLLLGVNYFPFPHNQAVMNSKDWTPYYFWGVGVKRYTPITTATTFTLPFGVGIKWFLGEQWGMQVQFKAEKLFADDFDGSDYDNPYSLSGFNLHRQDWLYMPTISIFYRPKDKGCKCGPLVDRNAVFRKKVQVDDDKR